MKESEAEKLRTILRNNFSSKESFEIDLDTQSIPLIVANVIKSTRSFSVGQVIYIYDGYWGMAEHVKVVAKFRRKHNWIRGVIPIKNLENFRAKVVYEPAVIKKLMGKSINSNIFTLFLDLPEWKERQEKFRENNSLAKKAITWLKEIFGF